MPKSSIENKRGGKENNRERDDEEAIREICLKEFQAALDSRAAARAKVLEEGCKAIKNHGMLVTKRLPKDVQDMIMGDFLSTSAMCSEMNVHAAGIKRKLIGNYRRENNKAIECPPSTLSEPHEPKRRRGHRLVASAPTASATTVQPKASAKVSSAPASTKASGVARPATKSTVQSTAAAGASSAPTRSTFLRSAKPSEVIRPTKSTVQSTAAAGASSAPTRSTFLRSAHTSTKPSEVKRPTKSTVQPRAFAAISSASASTVPPSRPPERSTVQPIAFSEISSTNSNSAVSLPSFPAVIPKDFFFSGPQGQILKLDDFEALNEMDDSSRSALKEFNKKLSEFLEE